MKKELKVGILATASPESGGIRQYTKGLLNTLLFDSTDIYYSILTNKKTDLPHHYFNHPRLKVDRRNIRLDKATKPKLIIDNFFQHLFILLTWLNNSFVSLFRNRKISNLGLDLLIVPFPSFIGVFSNTPYLVVIHDVQQIYFPKFFTIKERVFRHIIYQTAARNATFVLCDSNFTKNDLVRYFGVDKNRVKVVPQFIPDYVRNYEKELVQTQEIVEKYHLRKRFIFYPSQFWRHKNHLGLIHALNLIKRKYGEEIFLVLAGSKNRNYGNVVREVEELGIQSQIQYLGYVPDVEMPHLYKLATCLVYASLFDPNGIPIWEAFYLGVPVVSSDVCALPDQIGDAGLLFDPTNIEDMAEKIFKVWTDENLREGLKVKGYQRVGHLTPEFYADRWKEIIQEALAVGKRSTIRIPPIQ